MKSRTRQLVALALLFSAALLLTKFNYNVSHAGTDSAGSLQLTADKPDTRGWRNEFAAQNGKAANGNGNKGGGGGSTCPTMPPPPTTDTRCYDAASGCLDTTFAGGAGFLHNHFGDANFPNSEQAVIVQPDGRIVVDASARNNSLFTSFTVIRYNSDGTLDTTFGDPDSLNPTSRRGYALTKVTTGNDHPNGMALQPDGRILVVGMADTGSAVVRYNFDGTLDTGFGNGGIASLNFGSGKNVTAGPNRKLAIQSDGKILVGGLSGGTFAIARLLSNGALDPTFGSGGLVKAVPSGSSNGSSSGFGLAIQRIPAVTGEERIVLGGISTVNNNANTDWTLMRFKPNGSVDSAFGSGGTVKTVFGGFGDAIHELAVDNSNRIVAAGNSRVANISCGNYVIDYAVVRYNENGTLDTSFGGGKQTVDIIGMDQLYGLVIQTDDKPVVFGYSHSTDETVQMFSLVRFNADGSRDTTFGPLANGIVRFKFGVGGLAVGLAIQPIDRKIIGIGNAEPTSGSPDDLVVVRYLP